MNQNQKPHNPRPQSTKWHFAPAGELERIGWCLLCEGKVDAESRPNYSRWVADRYLESICEDCARALGWRLE